MSILFLPFGYPGYPEKEMMAHITESEAWLRSLAIDVTAAPAVIRPEDCANAVETAKKDNYDAVIVLLATWIEAPNVMQVLSSAGLEEKPMLLWSHDNVWDDREQATISFGAIAAAGVMRESFEEFGYKFKFTVGNPGNEALRKDVTDFCSAAKTMARLRRSRLGMLGYVSMGMYTGLADPIKVKRHFGTEIVHIDNYSLLAHLDEADPAQLEQEKQQLRQQWSVAPGISDALLDKNSAVYLGMKKLVAEHRLDSLTAKCQYEMSIDYGFTPCVALSLLGETMPVSCEGDIYLLLSQMILASVSGKTTTYGDMLAFVDGGMICAACGFAPKSFLNAEKPAIDQHTALYSGMLITTSFKPQPVTVIRLANYKDGFKMHLIEGHTEELKDFHEIGCPAYAGSVIKFENKSVEDFKQEIMSQHYAIVPGHHAGALRDFCRLMDIKVV